MLAVMEASQAVGPGKSSSTSDRPIEGADNLPGHDDFLQSGRTGRRNALADILSEHAAVTSSDLPSRLESLTTKDTKEPKPSTESCSTSKSS